MQKIVENISTIAEVNKDAGSYRFEINAAQLNRLAGIYMLRVATNERNINQRITIIM